MKYGLFIPLAATVFVAGSFAQTRIYRCGNEYTNTVPDAQAKGCKLVEGANVTVIQGPPRVVTPKPGASGSQPGQRVDAGEQRSRDSDSRSILEAELKKAETRLEELTREYNKGEPDRRPEEARNPNKYAERVQELKASIARLEGDITGIRRELSRAPPPSAAK
ncbi:hypothetical protein [Rhodoferax sp.]|uniref:hypothetical protein n=1 Tax=Rhodoferax sp. TaxID=50421 RepID=UPI002747F9F1|nr:hypothetical protein [Rhodoferax sp.]